jgi:penicillin-binding protein 1A
MLWMLQQVVKGGTGGGAALGDRPVAGKTGTSEGGRDLWFIGSIAQLTTGVWLGYDDSRETGNTSVVATLAWRDFMAPISRTLPLRQFPAKPQLQGSVQPDAKTGRPTAPRSGVPATEQAPEAPELPESFAPVPEGTPTDARPSGPGATVAPGSVAPTAAGPGTPPPVTTPPPPVAAPPVP